MRLLLVEVLASHLEYLLAPMTNALATKNHLVDQIVPAVREDAFPESRGPLTLEVHPYILVNIMTPLVHIETTLLSRQRVPPSYPEYADSKDLPDNILNRV